VERGLRECAISFGGDVIRELGSRGLLKCSVDEALGVVCVGEVVSSRSFASKKREALKGVGKPSMILPCCGEVMLGNCLGVKFNHGLHTQCLMSACGEGEYCQSCQKNADCSATGFPIYGDIRERVKHGVDYRDPKGKLTIPYANVAEKLGLNIDTAISAAAEMGWTIPAEQLVKRVTKRGRPGKSAAVSDTDSDTSEVPKKKRGRKPKAAKKAATEEDQIAVLVAEAYAESQSGDKIQALCNEAKNEAENSAAKALKDGEKLAKKEAIEAKKADIEATKAAIEAKKAEIEATKVAKKAEIEAKKAVKEAEKLAKKEAIEAKKAVKEAEKLAKKEAIEAKKGEIEATKAAKKAEIEATKASKKAEIEATKAAKKAEIEAEKAAKKEAIEATKAVKEAEKLAKKEAIEATKAVKEAEKLAKKEAIEAKKAAKEAEKLAKKEAIEAKKGVKEAEKLAKKEAIEAKKAVKEAKKEVIEAKKADKAAKAAKAAEPKEELEAEEVNDEVFDTLVVDGVEYIKQVDEDSGHIGLYHSETGEPVGIYNPETKSIEECEVEDSSDDEEE